MHRSRILTGAGLVLASTLLSGCIVAPPYAGGYGGGYATYGGPVYAAPAPVVVQPSVGFGFGYSRGYYGGGHRYWR